MRPSIAVALAEEFDFVEDRLIRTRSFGRLIKRIRFLVFEYFLCYLLRYWRQTVTECRFLASWYGMSETREQHDENLVLDDDNSRTPSGAGFLPNVGDLLAEPSSRKQVNIPKEVLAPLELFAEITDRKLTSLLTEAIAVYLKLYADEPDRGKLMPSKTSNRLHRLAIEMDCHPGYIVRVSTAIGCRLLEETFSKKTGKKDSLLFDSLVEIAKSQGRSVADLVAQYVRDGIQSDLQQKMKG